MTTSQTGTPDRRTALLLEPAPAIGAQAAAGILRTRFGIEATLTPLRSERDSNFLAVATDGRHLILKVSNSADEPAVIDMENAAMRHVEAVDPAFPIPRILPDRNGASATTVEAPDGRLHQVRVLTVVAGSAADQSALSPRFGTDFGSTCARLSGALRGFTHPAALRQLDWDPRVVTGLRPFAAQLPDAGRRELVEGLLDRFDILPAATATLPAFVLHGDVTLSNVLVDDGGQVSGVIDFGDMHHTARVSDLAIGLASLLRVTAEPWRPAGRFLDGYQQMTPLEPEEVEVLGELVLARLVATVLISAWRAPLHPENHAYVTSLDEGSWRMIELLSRPSPAALADRFHRLCGTSRTAAALPPDPTLLARRRAHLGGTLSPLFYREPLQVVRASGAWVHTADGRRYLDAYNNVPVVGHSHPAVVQAISRQAGTLNINSRYLHPHVVELAERLTATMPPELDTCVFVNSGSEANDLAWRMALAHTGNSGAVVTDHAYHGVTAATAPLSTNAYPASARPGHVAVFVPPPPGADARQSGRGAATDGIRRARAALRQAGHDVALVAVDTIFSSVGVLEPGDDYMRGLVDETHALGGLFLADEVQAGFGRGGRSLWRFQDFGLTPDFVTLGKPMGNGHPVAALVTRREIAERFVRVDEYFSTFGGNPVSCAAALTVLDVIEQTDLVERSGRVGEQLRTEIRQGMGLTVRGHGMFAGIDIRPAETGGVTATELAERLRERGVLVGTTGRADEVLKVRPPLIWESEHVELFLTALKDSFDGRRPADGA
ncbi:aminotransferase class III-fold pyridoxal phosphate-dependent enzyme [Streptomyces sp. NPDC051217]|uniref:aminotransferase class III-fold pyridoxal phosphate-dependent enzyme n=1 Tax=Streptomyces sp. NPDC051217 TaxID=3365644 RepID=UPI0037AADBB2